MTAKNGAVRRRRASVAAARWRAQRTTIGVVLCKPEARRGGDAAELLAFRMRTQNNPADEAA